MLGDAAQSASSYHRPRPAHPFFPVPSGEREELVSAATFREQVHPSSVARTGINGDIALRRAILYDAVCCFQQQFVATSHQPHRLATEAEQWLFSDDTQWPFSFVNICVVLGLDPTYLRRQLKRRLSEACIQRGAAVGL